MATHASAQISLYERDEFEGRSFTTEREVANLAQFGFNDRASSVVVSGDRGDRWEVCEERGFRGRCAVLRPGEYPSLQALGLNDRVSSVRAVDRNARIDDNRYAPSPRAAAPGARIELFANENFRGRSYSADSAIDDFRSVGFNDRASSIVVQSGRWEVCAGPRFSGRCVVLRRGEYRSLSAMGLNDQITSARALGRREVEDGQNAGAPPPASTATNQVDLYEREGFQGRVFTANTTVADFRGNGFNERASSAVVTGGRWEVCEDVQFAGRCLVLRPGQYPSLAALGLNDRISSTRAVGAGVRLDDNRAAPLPLVARDYRRRDNERLYDANVTSVRAVIEDAGRQCWIEPEQAVQERGSANVPRALLGAVIGGILGHQVGGGSGRDVATGIGVITGAAIGANSGRSDAGQQVITTNNVQRCARPSAQASPAYWDVTYTFRSQEYRVQMTRPPGATVLVNELGEPRA